MTKTHSSSQSWLFTLCALFSVFAGAFAVAGCKGKSEPAEQSPVGASTAATNAAPAAPVSLNGAGATFPYPLYSKWIAEFGKANPNIQINYQSIGSGGGIQQIKTGTVDFGATDAPMTESELTSAPRPLLHIPTTLGAVAVAYNLPEVKDLKLSSEALVGIFLGTIKKWNDPKIAATNQGVTLPASDVSAVFRSDGSGTTSVFTDYLSKVSPEFKEKVGQGKSVSWPSGLGAKGNEGVTGQVKTTPGAIGYVELAYAHQNKLSVAALQDKAGEFIVPSVEAITAAASGVELPESLTASITDSPAKGAYPIASYTYLLVYADNSQAGKGKALVNFLWWAAHEGQKHAAPLEYAPLPDKVIEKVEARIKSLTSGGKPLFGG